MAKKEYYLHEGVYMVCTNGLTKERVAVAHNAEVKRTVKIGSYLQANNLDRFSYLSCKYAFLIAALALGIMAALALNPATWVILAILIGMIIASFGMCYLLTLKQDWQRPIPDVKVHGFEAVTHMSYVTCPIGGVIKPFFSEGAANTQLGINTVFTMGECLLMYFGASGIADVLGASTAMGFLTNSLALAGNTAAGMEVGYAEEYAVRKSKVKDNYMASDMMSIPDEAPERGGDIRATEAQENIPYNDPVDTDRWKDHNDRPTPEQTEADANREASKVENREGNTKADTRNKANQEGVKLREELESKPRNQRPSQGEINRQVEARKAEVRSQEKAKIKTERQAARESIRSRDALRNQNARNAKPLRNAVKSLGILFLISLALDLGKSGASHLAAEGWAKDWEEEARAKSGVCTDE